MYYYFYQTYGYKIAKEDGKYVITINLPGYSKKEMTIESNDALRQLYIKSKDEVHDYKYNIPLLYDLSNVSASIKHGRLTISIPEDKSMITNKVIELQ